MWIFYALFAAILWGFDYAFAERILKNISMPVFLAIQLLFAGLIMAIIALLGNNWSEDFQVLAYSRKTLILFILGIVAFTAANALIVTSIQSKNATLSGLVEISYPFFIALISWMVFRDNQLNISTMIGGLLMLSGAFVIYYFNY